MDSNHRSIKQQIYSLSPLATRESSHIQFVHPASECLIIIANNKAKCKPFFAFFKNIFAAQKTAQVRLWCGCRGILRALMGALRQQDRRLHFAHKSTIITLFAASLYGSTVVAGSCVLAPEAYLPAKISPADLAHNFILPCLRS